MLLPWRELYLPLTKVTFSVNGAVSITRFPSPVSSAQGPRGHQNPFWILRLPISINETNSFLHWKVGPAHASPYQGQALCFYYVLFQNVCCFYLLNNSKCWCVHMSVHFQGAHVWVFMFVWTPESMSAGWPMSFKDPPGSVSSTRVTGECFYVCVLVTNSGPQACWESAFPTESTSQPTILPGLCFKLTKNWGPVLSHLWTIPKEGEMTHHTTTQNQDSAS